MLIQKFVYTLPTSTVDKAIALEEIKSIYESLYKPYKINVKIEQLSAREILVSIPFYAGLEIARRAALVKRSGIILDTDSEAINCVHFKTLYRAPRTFRVDCKTCMINDCLNLIMKATANRDRLYVNLRNPYYTFRIINMRDYKLLVLDIPNGRNKINKRSPFFRSFAPPATMDSITSRILVNLSRLSTGDVFLDPFAGSGSLLIESYFIGAFPIGLEIHPKNAYGAVFNAKLINAEINMLVGDATYMPILDNSIDAIATDPPYGRSASTFKRTLIFLYSRFLDEAYRVLKPRRYLAMFYPTNLETISSYAERIGFLETFKIRTRVHKDLSRYLTVFLKL